MLSWHHSNISSSATLKLQPVWVSFYTLSIYGWVPFLFQPHLKPLSFMIHLALTVGIIHITGNSCLSEHTMLSVLCCHWLLSHEMLAQPHACHSSADHISWPLNPELYCNLFTRVVHEAIISVCVCVRAFQPNWNPSVLQLEASEGVTCYILLHHCLHFISCPPPPPCQQQQRLHLFTKLLHKQTLIPV